MCVGDCGLRVSLSDVNVDSRHAVARAACLFTGYVRAMTELVWMGVVVSHSQLVMLIAEVWKRSETRGERVPHPILCLCDLSLVARGS